MGTCQCYTCVKSRGLEAENKKEPKEPVESYPVGSLVYDEWGDIGRIININPNSYYGDDTLYSIRRIGTSSTSGYISRYHSSIDRVESAPEPDADDKPTLCDRKRLLQQYLVRAYAKGTNAAVRELLDKINCLMDGGGQRDDKWFWSTLAVSLTDPKKVSFAPSIELVDINKRRRFCSWGKFLRGPAAQRGLQVEEGLIKRVTHHIGQSFPDSMVYRFEIVNEERIYEAYADESAGWNSCMTGEDWVRWYSDNPQTVSMVLIYQGQSYTGRALLWNTNEGVKLLDRIYPSNMGPHIAALELYAEEQGWDFRTNHNCEPGEFNSGEYYSVTMNRSNWGYPYMDTFKYTDDGPDDGVLVLNTRRGASVLEQTDGSFYEGTVLYCENCEIRINEDDTYGEDETLCESCYNEIYVYLEYKNARGRWVSGYFTRESCLDCDECSETFLEGDIAEVKGGDEELYLCPTCFKKEAAVCKECGDYFFTNTMKEKNERRYCLDCYDEHQEDTDTSEESEEGTSTLYETLTFGTTELPTTYITFEAVSSSLPVDGPTSTGEGVLQYIPKLTGIS